MSDFVYPSYFENFRKPGSTKFDQLGKVNKPFQVLAGGYQIIFKNGKTSQITGKEAKIEASSRKMKQLHKEDRRGHRSEFRMEHRQLKRSTVRK